MLGKKPPGNLQVAVRPFHFPGNEAEWDGLYLDGHIYEESLILQWTINIC